MNKIIALFGGKTLLVIAGIAIVAGGIYMGIGKQGAVSTTNDITNKTTASGTTGGASTYLNFATDNNGKMPENWPKDAPPAYSGALMMASFSKDVATGKLDPSVNYFIKASMTEVVDYYVNGLNANGWKIEANADSPAGYRVITAKKDTRSFFAFISIKPDSKVGTGVTSGVTF